MRLTRLVLAGLLVAALAAPLAADKKLSPSEAKEHGGEEATVCGEVVSAQFAATSRGSPTFLNLDKPYPDHVFTVVIWGRDRGKFGTLEKEYQGKQICVSGRIEEFRRIPQIVARAPKQITVEPAEGEPRREE